MSQDTPQSVFFDNFPSQLDGLSIVNMFERYATRGKILSFIVMPTAETQYGMITYQNANDAKACSRGLNGCQFAFWEDSDNYRIYILHITLSGPSDPYGYNEYFTPFWKNNAYGRTHSKNDFMRGGQHPHERRNSKDSSSSEETYDFRRNSHSQETYDFRRNSLSQSPTSSRRSRRGSRGRRTFIEF